MTSTSPSSAPGPTGQPHGSKPAVCFAHARRDRQARLPLQGRRRCEGSGRLDRTHRRWFTRESTRESALLPMAAPGLQAQHGPRRMPPGASRSGLVHALTLGAFNDFLAVSLRVAARCT